MQRALRGVIIERMVAHSNGYDWIESDLAGKIRNRIIGAMARQKSVIEVIETRIGGTSDFELPFIEIRPSLPYFLFIDPSFSFKTYIPSPLGT